MNQTAHLWYIAMERMASIFIHSRVLRHGEMSLSGRCCLPMFQTDRPQRDFPLESPPERRDRRSIRIQFMQEYQATSYIGGVQEEADARTCVKLKMERHQPQCKPSCTRSSTPRLTPASEPEGGSRYSANSLDALSATSGAPSFSTFCLFGIVAERSD